KPLTCSAVLKLSLLRMGLQDDAVVCPRTSRILRCCLPQNGARQPWATTLRKQDTTLSHSGRGRGSLSALPLPSKRSKNPRKKPGVTTEAGLTLTCGSGRRPVTWAAMATSPCPSPPSNRSPTIGILPTTVLTLYSGMIVPCKSTLLAWRSTLPATVRPRAPPWARSCCIVTTPVIAKGNAAQRRSLEMHDQSRICCLGWETGVRASGAAWRGVLCMARQCAHEGLGIEHPLAQGHVYTLTPMLDRDNREAALVHGEVAQLEAEVGISSLVELERSVGR